MDRDDGLNMRNWGYYEPTSSLKENLGLQLMSSMPEKPLFGWCNPAMFTGTNAAYHYRDIGASQEAFTMDYMRNARFNQREKYFNMIPGNSYCPVIPETSSAHQMQMVRRPDLSSEEKVMEEAAVEKPAISNKKRQRTKTPKSPKGKKPKRQPHPRKEESSPAALRPRSTKKNAQVMINGIDLDIRSIPVPVCSCTGTPQQCYRWGSGGWQSACCTTGMSMYPLPMSTKRRGARIAGRKMSIGAFKKVLQKLAAEEYNFSNPIDLRTHWAKHGTNKFVTIR